MVVGRSAYRCNINFLLVFAAALNFDPCGDDKYRFLSDSLGSPLEELAV